MLAHKGGGEVRVPKRLQRNKALEIVFDPQSHKYVLLNYSNTAHMQKIMHASLLPSSIFF